MKGIGKGPEKTAFCITCPCAKHRRTLNDHRVVGSLSYISFEKPPYTISHLLLVVNWHLKDIRITVRAESQLMAPSFVPAGVLVQEQPPSQWHADLFQVPKPLLAAPSPSSLAVSINMIDAKWLRFPDIDRFPLDFQGISHSSRDLLLQFQQKLMVEASRSIWWGLGTSALRFSVFKVCIKAFMALSLEGREAWESQPREAIDCSSLFFWSIWTAWSCRQTTDYLEKVRYQHCFVWHYSRKEKT